jgi:hypothetical protein
MNGSTKKQKLFSKRCFSGIGVTDNAKCPSSVYLVFKSHSYFFEDAKIHNVIETQWLF